MANHSFLSTCSGRLTNGFKHPDTMHGAGTPLPGKYFGCLISTFEGSSTAFGVIKTFFTENVRFLSVLYECAHGQFTMMDRLEWYLENISRQQIRINGRLRQQTLPNGIQCGITIFGKAISDALSQIKITFNTCSKVFGVGEA